MSRKWTAALFVLLTLAVGACRGGQDESGVAGFGPPTLNPAPGTTEQTPEGQPRAVTPKVRVDTLGQYSWSLRDTRTGQVRGSVNQDSFANTAESMIKAWIAFDYLRGLQDRNAEPSPGDLAIMHRMLHVSDDQAAQQLYLQRGGDAVVRRLISTCGLRNTTVTRNWWSKTMITAADATRMGQCLFDGEHLGPKWTEWLRKEMRDVTPSNAFGIAEAPGLAGKQPAIKNGWTAHSATNNWAVNCLAVWDHQVLAVLVSYPRHLGQQHGAGVCRQVADQLFPAR